ncbi:MAG TPA: mechanosensitive ion channel, partial [Phnomibacter sp.]|nr:mechanosensitive ion channel [Phnomibacter sp.]
PAEKLRQIPSIIKDAIENPPGTTFDRAHFSAFADFSLNFEVVYFIDDADIKVYMDAHQQINLSIYQAFEQQGIEFAYPTQTIYLETGQHTPQVAGGA